jgi:hypothetical protein
MTDAELLQTLDRMKGTMIAVATGGPRIGKVQHEFTRAFDEVSLELSNRQIPNPLPYRDLWEWYGRWSSGDMPSWQSRRNFVNDLFGDLTRTIRDGGKSGGQSPKPTGWPRVDRAVTELRERLASAASEEQFQAVGLLCREALISLAQAVFDPAAHPTLDGLEAKPDRCKADARRLHRRGVRRAPE